MKKSIFSLLLLIVPILVHPAEKSCCTKALDPAKFSDRSLFQVETGWRDDRGNPVKLADFHGRPQVVTMFFSTCVTACPLLVNDLKRIEAAMPEGIRTNVSFVLISFDSERDTPPVLAKFRKRHQLAANWSLLHGSEDDVLEIASLLGIKFKKESQGGFAHSNTISLLNGEGEIVTQQVGLNRDPAPFSQTVAETASTQITPKKASQAD